MDVVRRKFPDLQDFADDLYVDGATTGKPSITSGLCTVNKGDGKLYFINLMAGTLFVHMLLTPAVYLSCLHLITWKHQAAVLPYIFDSCCVLDHSKYFQNINLSKRECCVTVPG